MSLLDRLRPPARAPRRPAAQDVAAEVVEASIDADSAALALAECLERRKAAIRAAMKAGIIPSALGARAQQRRAVDSGFAAAGLTDHYTVERTTTAPAGFIEQAGLLIAKEPPR
jgi:hypothetical protein